jgi:branched-chain amino acid transport system permease protein
MLLALPVAPLVAAAGALIFGFFVVRLTQTYFAMLSLAFGQIVFTVIFKWKAFTGGDDGLLDVWPPLLLKSPVAYYYFALAVVALCVFLLHAIVESPFGYACGRSGEPRRARFIGINVRRHQLSPGDLRAPFRVAAPSSRSTTVACSGLLYFTKSFEPLVVALLGGEESFRRPSGGCLLLQDPQWASPAVAHLLALFLGAVVIAVMWLPQGCVGLREAHMDAVVSRG